jgi:alpha-galactosidase
MSWFELLCRALGRDDLVPAGSQVPFSVVAETPIAWEEPRLERRGDHGWELSAGSRQGLLASWRVREHPGTGAIECAGSVRNEGRAAIEGVREVRTLDLAVGLGEAWGEAWVRTVNGARFLSASFPPDDFRHRDRQLMRAQGDYTAISVASLADGRSSGHSLPCAILAGEHADRGLALFYEWSGMWQIGIKQEATPGGGSSWPWATRITAGIWGLELDLRPGEELPLPNLLLVGFDGDLDAGGNALRRQVRDRIAPSLAGGAPLPPVTFNHWFAFENEFDASSLQLAADVCAELGVEYFCIDAGWFPGGFRRGIGNWSDGDPAKFPDGIGAFGGWLRERGLPLGLWIEPEFAHVDSEVHRAHPDWFLPGPHVSPWYRVGEDFSYDNQVSREEPESHSGDSFALIDLGRPEARQWCIDLVVEAYERWGVRWVRWDTNQQPRPHWELGVPAGRIGINQINHVQGLYEVFDEILGACPDLFLEQCASGGHRIDLGTVRRGHAFWMNDQTMQTDIVRAMQHGLNTVLPGIYANTNLCQGRFDYDDYDFLSHGCGSFGISERLWEAPPAALDRYRAAIDRFKGYRHLLGGEYSRPTGNPSSRFEPAQVAWSDGGEAVEMEFNAGGVRRQAAVRHARQ